MSEPGQWVLEEAQRLYEDASLRGDLTDDEAGPLLAWAVDQIKARAVQADRPDEAARLAVIAALRNAIRAVGKFAALRTYAPETDQRAALILAAERLRDLGWRLDAETFFVKQRDLPGDAMIRALLGVLAPAAFTDDASGPDAPSAPTVSIGEDDAFAPSDIY
ncbi:MAG: hypothetical protein ACUVS2_12000 [Candidatus Flexifilum sp.]